MRTTTLRHNRIDLALHELRGGRGRPLLLLHGLGERTPAEVPAHAADWPGPVHGLDFTGHGASSIPVGGGYYCEVLMADVDHALSEIGPSTLLGRGLGAYVALLISGARPDLVRGAVVTDGPGLAGGGPQPGSPVVVGRTRSTSTPDPNALLELARDVRPPDYASTFLRQATHLSDLETVLAVSARHRPPWLQAVAGEPGVVEVSLADGLRRFATV